MRRFWILPRRAFRWVSQLQTSLRVEKPDRLRLWWLCWQSSSGSECLPFIAVDLFASSWHRPNNTSLWVRIPTHSIFLFISLSCYEAGWKDLDKCLAKIPTHLRTEVGIIRLDEQKTRTAGSISRINQFPHCLWSYLFVSKTSIANINWY